MYCMTDSICIQTKVSDLNLNGKSLKTVAAAAITNKTKASSVVLSVFPFIKKPSSKTFLLNSS
jgi:hypothetical protein